MRNKPFFKELLVFSLTAMVVVSSFMTFLNGFLTTKRLAYKEQLGIYAVNLMYDFDTLFDLTAQMEELKQITTPEVFRGLDINYDSRVIPIYYKFKAEKTEVEIISSVPGSIHYRLLNDNISSNRSFLFRYTVSNGVIDSVEEIELVTGIDNAGGVFYQ